MEKIFLHTCCAPCSIYQIKLLKEHNLEPVCFWYNINIHPYTEYMKRKQTLEEYFGVETLRVIARQPLTVTDTLSKYDVRVKVVGGGLSGQAGAVRHGIARALNVANEEEFRPSLKSNGFTR